MALIAPTTTADGRQSQRMGSYTKFWQQDANKEEEVDTDIRRSGYTELVNGQSVFVYAMNMLDAFQVITMQRRSYTSTPGQDLSTSRASTRGSPSLRRSLGMNITLRRR